MFPNLNAEMTRYNVSVDTLAEILGIDPVNVRMRLKGNTNILFGEAHSIIRYFNETFGTSFTLDYLFNLKAISVQPIAV